jgi:hypothetical protein
LILRRLRFLNLNLCEAWQFQSLRGVVAVVVSGEGTDPRDALVPPKPIPTPIPTVTVFVTPSPSPTN